MKTYESMSGRQLAVLTLTRQEEMLSRLDRLETLQEDVNSLFESQVKCNQWRENHEKAETNRLIVWGLLITAISLVSSTAISFFT